MDSRNFQVGIPNKEMPKEQGSGPEKQEEKTAAEPKITPTEPNEPEEQQAPEMVIEEPGIPVKKEKQKEDIEQAATIKTEDRGELTESDVAFNDDVHTPEIAARLLDEVNKSNS